MAVKDTWRIFTQYVRLHTKTALEYRINFVVQSLFMFLNDLTWLILFTYLFKATGTVNGYGPKEAIILFGLGAWSYGLTDLFLGNRGQLWQLVHDGRFDFYLSAPCDELFHCLISKSSPPGFGDVMFGITVLAWFAPEHFFLLLLLGLLGGVAWIAGCILIDSLAFYLARPRSLSRSLFALLLGFGTWPIDAFDYRVRMVLYLTPLAFMVAVPYNLARDFLWSNFGWFVLIVFLFLVLAVSVFKQGVRRYESGNLMTVRT